MSGPTHKCCHNCQWFAPREPVLFSRDYVGSCKCPLPESLLKYDDDSWTIMPMSSFNDGGNCDAFSPKEDAPP